MTGSHSSGALAAWEAQQGECGAAAPPELSQGFGVTVPEGASAARRPQTARSARQGGLGDAVAILRRCEGARGWRRASPAGGVWFHCFILFLNIVLLTCV